MSSDLASFRPGQLLNPRVEAGAFRATIPTDRGKTYLLEDKDSLNSSAWTFVRLTAGDGSDHEIAEPLGAGTNRFYRVRRIP